MFITHHGKKKCGYSMMRKTRDIEPHETSGDIQGKKKSKCILWHNDQRVTAGIRKKKEEMAGNGIFAAATLLSLLDFVFECDQKFGATCRREQRDYFTVDAKNRKVYTETKRKKDNTAEDKNVEEAVSR